MVEIEPTDESSERIDAETDRRSILKAVGAAGILSGSAMAPASTAGASDGTEPDTQQSIPTQQEQDKTSSDAVDSPGGGRRIVGDQGYTTIAEAWDDAESGDIVYIHSSYDAKEADEAFPIVLDYEEKEVMLSGGHPSGSVIDASHCENNVIEVLGRGMNDYRNNPVVQNLKIIGGNVGLRIQAAPFSSYQNLVFYNTGSHAVEIAGYVDPDSGRSKGTFGATFTNCQAFQSGGDGFRTNKNAYAHGTTFQSCRATANRGAGFRLRGYICKIHGGTTQLNFDYGIEARLGKAMNIRGVYIEGNSRGNEFPVEVYVRNADGFTIDTCYFHGIVSRAVSHDFESVCRGVNAHQTQHLNVRSCTARNYDDGFIALFGCEDPDIHCESHHVFDAEMLAEDPYRRQNYRVRSAGRILPCDLSGIDGHHEGDHGYHVGQHTEGPAIWRNGRWHVADTETL